MRRLDLTDFDEVVVLRLMDGELLPMTGGERVEAVRRMVARGYKEREMAERLHVHATQVSRDKRRLGLTRPPRHKGVPYRLTRRALIALQEPVRGQSAPAMPQRKETPCHAAR